MGTFVKKKKVLYLVTESEWAGASRYVFDLATHLPPQFEAVVAASGKGDVLAALNERGVSTRYLRYLPRAIDPLKDFLAFWEILLLYFRERPDIIHLNSSKAGWLGSVAAFPYKLLTLNFKLLTIFTAHGWVFNEPGRANRFFRFLERLASRFRDTIICVSESDRQEALKRRIAPPNKLITIHNGIDAAALNFFDRDTARRRLLNIERGAWSVEPTLIGSIANLYPNKGLMYLIEAIHALKTTFPATFHIPHPTFKVIIIGDGPERPRLKDLIKKYGLQERVLLAGQIPEAWRYLKALDCFVLPSVKEGLPYVILEALAAGVAVVASAVGGVPEIEKAGGRVQLVPPQNPEALAAAIREMTAETHNASPPFPEEFTLKKMLEKTAAIYKFHK